MNKWSVQRAQVVCVRSAKGETRVSADRRVSATKRERSSEGRVALTETTFVRKERELHVCTGLR